MGVRFRPGADTAFYNNEPCFIRRRRSSAACARKAHRYCAMRHGSGTTWPRTSSPARWSSRRVLVDPQGVHVGPGRPHVRLSHLGRRFQQSQPVLADQRHPINLAPAGLGTRSSPGPAGSPGGWTLPRRGAPARHNPLILRRRRQWHGGRARTARSPAGKLSCRRQAARSDGTSGVRPSAGAPDSRRPLCTSRTAGRT